MRFLTFAGMSMSGVSHSLMTFLSVCVLAGPAQAHVDPVTGQDYRDFLRNDGQGSCCDWHDCRPAHAPVTEPDGQTIVDFGNNRYRFDPSKVVRRPSDDGNWRVCGDARQLKCIIAPAQSRMMPMVLDRVDQVRAPSVVIPGLSPGSGRLEAAAPVP